MRDHTVFPLRPHHGLCLAFFEGKGYSEGFTAHMQDVLEHLTETDRTCIRLITDTDVICTACPNNDHGVCLERERVYGFDYGVLELCGLHAGEQLTFEAFAQLVQACIISPGKRSEICGGCQWEYICANRKSRWEAIVRGA